MKNINVNKFLFLLTSIAPIPVFCIVFYYIYEGLLHVDVLPLDGNEYPKWIITAIDIIKISVGFIVLILVPMFFLYFFVIINNWIFYGMASMIRNEFVESEIKITKSYDNSKGYCYDINSQYQVVCSYSDKRFYITPNWGNTKEYIKFYSLNSFKEINKFAIEKYKYFI